MIFLQFIINFALFFIGVAGMLINTANALILLICIEIMLLSVNLNFVFCSLYLDDFYGQGFSIFILTTAASESAIGLAILILFNRIRGSINITDGMNLKY